jgi:hypothetical protein
MLVTVLAPPDGDRQAAGDHLDRHADLDRLFARIGQLGGHQRACLFLSYPLA